MQPRECAGFLWAGHPVLPLHPIGVVLCFLEEALCVHRFKSLVLRSGGLSGLRLQPTPIFFSESPEMELSPGAASLPGLVYRPTSLPSAFTPLPLTTAPYSPRGTHSKERVL